MKLFASAAPGLEPVLQQEVAALPGAGEAQLVEGGVEFVGTPEVANLLLRSAGRVLLRLARFPARRLPQLVEACAAAPWEKYLRGAAAQVKATCHKSRIYHSGAAAERVLEGIRQRLGAGGPAADAPLVFLRGVRDEWELSLDTSGELLHRRGYRLDPGEAPLRETLAAGLLLHAGYAGGPLFDLCCGSGTFAIEAALLRRRIAPGLLRDFAFTRWPDFDRARWERLRDEARRRILPPSPADPAIVGLDISPQAIARARGNAERARVLEAIDFRVADLFSLSAPGDLSACTVVANPPYGKRLAAGDRGLPLYGRLGRHLRARFAGARALVLCGAPADAAALGLGLPLLRVRNGGLPIIAAAGAIAATAAPAAPGRPPAGTGAPPAPRTAPAAAARGSAPPAAPGTPPSSRASSARSPARS